MNMVTNAFTVFEKSILASERILQAQGTDPTTLQPFTISQKELSEEDPNINLVAVLIPLMLIHCHRGWCWTSCCRFICR